MSVVQHFHKRRGGDFRFLAKTSNFTSPGTSSFSDLRYMTMHFPFSCLDPTMNNHRTDASSLNSNSDRQFYEESYNPIYNFFNARPVLVHQYERVLTSRDLQDSK